MYCSNDLPPTKPKPTDIISIPVRVAIDIIAAKRGTPKLIGCAITKPDTTILSTPTPIRKPLYQPEIFLFTAPCTIQAIPLKSKVYAPRNIKNTAVCNGNDMTMLANIIASAPSAMLATRDDLLTSGAAAIPIAILSIPTISKAMERSTMIEYIATPGNVRTTIDKIMDIAPKPTCATRNQLGDFLIP